MALRLSSEQRFLVDAARSGLGVESSPGQLHPPQPSMDWEATLRLAIREGLAPLAYAGLRTAESSLPDGLRVELRMGYLASLARTRAYLEPTLARLLPALEGAGFRPILLKGAALAYTVYRDPVHRTMADIDLLIPADKMSGAAELLHAMGFTPEGPSGVSDHHLGPLYSPESPLGVELHSLLLPASSPYRVDLPGCRARSAVSEIAGLEGRVLAPVDALHLACLHLSYSHRYRWFPLRTLVDILALTIRWAREMDWDLLLDIARASRTTGAVYWPLWLAHDWVGAPIPDSVLSRLAPPTMFARLMAGAATPNDLLKDGLRRPNRADGVLHRLLLELSLYQGCSVLEQIGALLGGLFPPPEAVGHLPRELTRSRMRYTAHLVRPGRILRGTAAFGRLLARES